MNEVNKSNICRLAAAEMINNTSNSFCRTHSKAKRLSTQMQCLFKMLSVCVTLTILSDFSNTTGRQISSKVYLVTSQ